MREKEGKGNGREGKKSLGRAFLQKRPPQTPPQKLLYGWRQGRRVGTARTCLSAPIGFGSGRPPCRSIAPNVGQAFQPACSKMQGNGRLESLPHNRRSGDRQDAGPTANHSSPPTPSPRMERGPDGSRQGVPWPPIRNGGHGPPYLAEPPMLM